MKHLRANLVFLGLSLAICCFAYPLALWTVGQAVFPDKADGSLLTVGDRVVGSRQIAQPFTGDEYFWPRPSAAAYNGAAASGSNWGANNPKLRDRVAQFLGPIVKYKAGSSSAGTGPEPRIPQQDIEQWFATKPDRVADWAGEYSVAATNWVKTDFPKDRYGLQGEYVAQWAKYHPEVIDEWKKANPTKSDDPKPEDLVSTFFTSFAKVHPGKWPAVVGTTEKHIEPTAPDGAVHALFFDMWLQDPANRSKVTDIEPAPADMVTASGAGLDPHITLRNALCVYQLDRIVAKRSSPGRDAEKTRNAITELANSLAFAPLYGLIGEPVVNVLELNIELDRRFPIPSVPTP